MTQRPANYEQKFLQIFAAIVLSGIFLFIFPGGEIASYFTMLIGSGFAFLFFVSVISKRVGSVQGNDSDGIRHFSNGENIWNVTSRVSGLFFVVILLLIFLNIFLKNKKKIYNSQTPQEFTTFKNLSFMILIVQFALVYIFIRNSFKAFKLKTNNEMLNNIMQTIMKNINLFLLFFTFFNYGIALIMYIIIVKFTTDG